MFLISSMCWIPPLAQARVILMGFNIFGDFQKNEYFGGYEDFVDILGGSSQNWTIFKGHFYAF